MERHEGHEKKLVPHYSIITQAKKDSKAVRPVVELALKVEPNAQNTDNAKKQWNTAYNRLTLQQQSLFDLAMPYFIK